jgi:hypothetical protein
MIHILNNLTSDYDIQLALMERKVGDADNSFQLKKSEENQMSDSKD